MHYHVEASSAGCLPEYYTFHGTLASATEDFKQCLESYYFFDCELFNAQPLQSYVDDLHLEDGIFVVRVFDCECLEGERITK